MHSVTKLSRILKTGSRDYNFFILNFGIEKLLPGLQSLPDTRIILFHLCEVVQKLPESKPSTQNNDIRSKLRNIHNVFQVLESLR